MIQLNKSSHPGEELIRGSIMLDLIDKNSIEYKARICLSLSMKPNSTLWAKHYWKSVAEQLLQKQSHPKK